jgi:hypothetical protein
MLRHQDIHVRSTESLRTTRRVKVERRWQHLAEIFVLLRVWYGLKAVFEMMPSLGKKRW